MNSTTSRGPRRIAPHIADEASNPPGHDPLSTTEEVARPTAGFNMSEWVTTSRENQTLSARIEDRAVLADIRRLIAPARPSGNRRAA